MNLCIIRLCKCHIRISVPLPHLSIEAWILSRYWLIHIQVISMSSRCVSSYSCFLLPVGLFVTRFHLAINILWSGQVLKYSILWCHQSSWGPCLRGAVTADDDKTRVCMVQLPLTMMGLMSAWYSYRWRWWGPCLRVHGTVTIDDDGTRVWVVQLPLTMMRPMSLWYSYCWRWWDPCLLRVWCLRVSWSQQSPNHPLANQTTL